MRGKFARMRRHHAQNRVAGAAFAGDRDLDAGLGHPFGGDGAQRHLVHVDEMLAQSADVDFRPIGPRVRFENLNDFLNGAEGILAGACRLNAGMVAGHIAMSTLAAHVAVLAALHHLAVHSRRHLGKCVNRGADNRKTGERGLPGKFGHRSSPAHDAPLTL